MCLSFCLSTGGVHISHNALQHYPEFHGADTWGVPGQVQLGGYPYPIMLSKIIQNSMGQTPGGYPVRSSQGSTLPGQDGGYPARSGWGGTLLGQDWGVPCRGYPPGRVPPRQGTPLAGYPPGPGQDGRVSS